MSSSTSDTKMVWIQRTYWALPVAALVATIWARMDLLGDSFWSIATGLWILHHRSLPAVDPFSFTADRAWIVHMPLCQLVLGMVAERCGILAVELLGTLVFSAALLLLWLPHARSMPARLLTWLLSLGLVLLQADDLCVRGQVFGDVCYAVLVLLLLRVRTGRAVHPVAAAAFGCLWINLHASCFLLVVLPLFWAIGLRCLPRSERPSLRPCLQLAAYGAAGMLVNPYHVRLVVDLLRLWASSDTHHVDLFSPPDFGSPMVLVTFLLVGGTAGLCLKARTNAGGVPEAMMLLALLCASAGARRYLPLAASLGVAVVGRFSSAHWAASIPSGWHRAVLVAANAAAAWITWAGLAPDKDPWRDVPLEEARLIEQLPLPDRVANLYHWGGFLDYSWAGRRKVFVDGRNQLFEGGAFQAAFQLARIDDWQAILDRYGINTVLWERGSPLDQALAESKNWMLVRRGAIAVLYVRRHPLLAVPRSSPPMKIIDTGAPPETP